MAIELAIAIPDGYHIYGANSSAFPTEIKVNDAGTLKLTKPFEIPAGESVEKDGKLDYWLENTVILKANFHVPEDFDSSTVSGEVKYMICNDVGCQPPASKKFTAELKK